MTRRHVPVRVRWSDLDANAHVNNAAMLILLEEARIQAFWGDGAAATMWLVARQEIEYLVPVPYQSRPIDVQLWIGRLGGASIEICYEVWSPLGVEPVVQYARAASTVVLVDSATRRPRKMAEAERAGWTPLMDEPLRFTRRP